VTTRKATAQYRQGDVYLVATAGPAAGAVPVARDNGRIVLAYGEVTGHAHAITAPTAALLADPETGQRWLVAPDGAVIGHEEHSQVQLPAGTYEVRTQREYRPEGVRQVAD